MSKGVEVGTRVAGVFAEGFLGPRREAGVGVVMGGVVDEIAGEFAADDEFFEERFAVGRWGGGIGDLQSDVEGGDLAEVEVGGEGGGVVGGRLVAGGVVMGELLGEEGGEAFGGGGLAADEVGGDGRDGAVEF